MPTEVRRAFVRHARRAVDGLVAMFRRARERARLRRELEWLDDHRLHDIGCQRRELEAEARKPFWRH